MKYSLNISHFLEEISSLSSSNDFPVFLCMDHWGRLSSLSFLFFGTLSSNGYIFLFLLCFSLLFFSELFVRPPQIIISPFCIYFSWGLSCTLSPVQCHEPPSIVHQAIYLSDIVSQIYFSLPLYNHKGFKSYLNGLVAFPTFFNLRLNLAIRSSWSEPQSAPGLVFAACIELLHLCLQRIESIWFRCWPSGDVHV